MHCTVAGVYLISAKEQFIIYHLRKVNYDIFYCQFSDENVENEEARLKFSLF